MTDVTSRNGNVDRETSYEPPDTGSAGSGGKSTGTTASAGETSYEPPDTGSTGSGGKSTGTTAPARESAE